MQILYYFNDLQAFPRGSPLVADVSRAILNVTEGDKMKEIEKAWLGTETNCPDSNTQAFSNSLSLASFWGLFLIAGLASLLALIISVGKFLYMEREEICRRLNAKVSLGRRIRHTLKIFDERRTFRGRDLEDKSGINVVHGTCTIESPPNSNCPPTPSSHSTHVLGDQGTPSREYADLSPTGQVSQPLAAIEQIVHPTHEGTRIPEIVHETS
jgi:hypothetical protein